MYRSVFALLVMIQLMSCASDNECLSEVTGSEPISVTSVTKATEGGTSSYNFGTNEIVWLWAKKMSDNSEYIKAWQLNANGNGGFSSVTAGADKYWPSDGSLLNVYALHGNFNNSITEGSTSWSTLTSLTHTVETDQSSDANKRLSDLLYSHSSNAVALEQPVPLTFDHLLAKITVKLDMNNSQNIESADLNNATISITNILPNAVFDSSNGTAANGSGDKTTITAGKITNTTLSGVIEIGSAIVPPQSFVNNGNANIIQIALSDGRTFSYTPNDIDLEKGQEYAYTLRIIGKKVIGTLTVSDFTQDTKEQSFKDYFDICTDLNGRTYLGSPTAPHDLSYDYNGKMNTANCYVVTNPGYYKFPLVYGNAIKDGKTNSIAYGINENGIIISSTFVNHLSNQISNPYIYNNEGCTANSAVLVWQDAENLVSNIELCDDNKYIKFEINQGNIEEGNAVIAVKDNTGEDGTIMWSWHIWVTNKNVYNTYTYGDYKFMPIALGQRETVEGTTCTFYQWGRKDPFKGATTNEEGSVDNGEESVGNTLDPQEHYYTSITNPGKFINGTSENPYRYDWILEDLLDLWDVGNKEQESTKRTSIKSIYDPSPVGFKVPPPAAFSEEMFNTSEFTEGFKGTVDGDFWRAFGYLIWNTSLSTYVGEHGNYWACIPIGDGIKWRWSYCLEFQPNLLLPQGKYVRSRGCTVRPVTDK